MDEFRVVAHPATEGCYEKIPVESRIVAFWRTMIGKKVAMAVTGAVMALFVLAPHLGESKGLRRAGRDQPLRALPPEVRPARARLRTTPLGLRIVLLPCVVTHVTAAVQLTRMKRAGARSGKPSNATWR